MYTFKDLVEITAKLRAEDGCPWDREQTFESLRKYMREEAEEAVQAVDKNAGKGQKTLTNYSKTDINDRVSQTRTKTVRTCFFSDSV